MGAECRAAAAKISPRRAIFPGRALPAALLDSLD